MEVELDPHTSNNLDFSPVPSAPPIELVASYIAETSIVRAIVQGSGGPENTEITDAGLRFVRHLLATTTPSLCNALPNLKHSESIREIAREFIKQSGSAAVALHSMYAVMQP
jgi:hypothetical protein